MFEIEQIISIKIYLALDNLQRLICHKNQTNQPINQPFNISVILLSTLRISTKKDWYWVNPYGVVANVLDLVIIVVKTINFSSFIVFQFCFYYIMLFCYSLIIFWSAFYSAWVNPFLVFLNIYIIFLSHSSTELISWLYS